MQHYNIALLIHCIIYNVIQHRNVICVHWPPSIFFLFTKAQKRINKTLVNFLHIKIFIVVIFCFLNRYFVKNLSYVSSKYVKCHLSYFFTSKSLPFVLFIFRHIMIKIMVSDCTICEKGQH